MSTTYLIDEDVDIGAEGLLGMVELEELDRVVFLPGRLVIAQVLWQSEAAPVCLCHVQNRCER